MRASTQALTRIFASARPGRGPSRHHDWLLWLLAEEDRRLQALITREPARHTEGHPLVLLAHESPGMRLWAAVTLGRSGGPGVVARLAMMLHERDDRRLIGAIGLGHLRDERAMPHLLEAILHEDPGIRLTAVVTMAWLGAPAAPALDDLARLARRDGDRRIRMACGHAIRCIRAELDGARTELLAAQAPAGLGTEPEAAAAPAGLGTEPEAAEMPAGRGTELSAEGGSGM